MSDYDESSNVARAIQVLEKAVLNILDEKFPKAVGPKYISEKSNIPRIGGQLNGRKLRNDGIVESLLYKLEKERKVERAEQPNGKGGWKLLRMSTTKK